MAAGTPIATAFVEIRPETTSFGQVLTEQTGPQVDQAGAALGKRMGDALAQGFTAARTVSQGLGDIGSGLTEVGQRIAGVAREADEARDIAAQTEAVIRSTGSAANVSAGEIAELSSRLADKAAVDDDLVQSGANVLLTFTNIRNEVGEGNRIFDDATSAALDMSVALGQDLQSASILVGKALNDPIAGMTALGRAGVQFSDDQKAAIRALVESNDLLGAQRIVLGELERQFGGSAEAQASGMDRVTTAAGNLKEAFGTALVPAIDVLAPRLEDAVGLFEDLPTPIQTTIVVAGGLVSVLGPVGRAIDGVRSIRDVLGGGGREAAVGLDMATGATGRMSRALPLLRTALATAGIAGAVVGILDMAGAFDSAGESVDELSRKSDEALVKVFDSWQAMQQLSEGSTSLTDVFGGILGIDDRGESAVVDRFTELAEGSIATAERLRDALAAAGEDVSGLDEILAGVAEGNRQAAVDTQANTEATEELTTATGESAGAMRDSVGAAADLSGEMERLTQRRLDMTAAMEAGLPTDLALEQAFVDSQQALATYRDTMADSETTALDRHEAGITLLETFLREGDAARESAENQATAAGRAATATQEGVDAQLETLGRLVQQLDAGSPLRSQLEAYIAQLGRIPRNISTTVETEYVDTRFVGSGPRARQRASGGRAEKGQPYIVGEDQPELFVPDESGMILPQVPRTKGGTLGGVTIQIDGPLVYVDAPGADRGAVTDMATQLPGVAQQAARALAQVAAVG